MTPSYPYAPTARPTRRAVGVAAMAAAATLLTGCSIDVVTTKDSKPIDVSVSDKSSPTPSGRKASARTEAGQPAVTVRIPKSWHRGKSPGSAATFFGPESTASILPSVSVEADTESYWTDAEGALAEYRQQRSRSTGYRAIGQREEHVKSLGIQRVTYTWTGETSGTMYEVGVLVAVSMKGTLHTVSIRGTISNKADGGRKIIDDVVGTIRVNDIPIAPVMKS